MDYLEELEKIQTQTKDLQERSTALSEEYQRLAVESVDSLPADRERIIDHVSDILAELILIPSEICELRRRRALITMVHYREEYRKIDQEIDRARARGDGDREKLINRRTSFINGFRSYGIDLIQWEQNIAEATSQERRDLLENRFQSEMQQAAIDYASGAPKPEPVLHRDALDRMTIFNRIMHS